jgi:hypothetical protein
MGEILGVPTNEIDFQIRMFERNVNSSPSYKDLASGFTAVNDIIKEIEAIIRASQVDAYKEFTYDPDGNITEQGIWTNSAKTTQLFNIVYSYTGDDLTLITTTRTIDGFSYNKTLSYDVNGNLESIEIVTV